MYISSSCQCQLCLLAILARGQLAGYKVLQASLNHREICYCKVEIIKTKLKGFLKLSFMVKNYIIFQLRVGEFNSTNS